MLWNKLSEFNIRSKRINVNYDNKYIEKDYVLIDEISGSKFLKGLKNIKIKVMIISLIKYVKLVVVK